MSGRYASYWNAFLFVLLLINLFAKDLIVLALFETGTGKGDTSTLPLIDQCERFRIVPYYPIHLGPNQGDYSNK